MTGKECKVIDGSNASKLINDPRRTAWCTLGKSEPEATGMSYTRHVRMYMCTASLVSFGFKLQSQLPQNSVLNLRVENVLGA